MSSALDGEIEIGGFRIGRNALLALNATWPFGTLEIRRDHLVLRTFFRRYTFPRESILALSTFSGLFSRGIRIEHSVSNYPRFIVFWSSHVSRLQRRLTDAGFSVADAQT
jgi:hypothetical protein